MWEYCLCSQRWLSYGTGVRWVAFLHVAVAAAANWKLCPSMPRRSNGRVERPKHVYRLSAARPWRSKQGHAAISERCVDERRYDSYTYQYVGVWHGCAKGTLRNEYGWRVYLRYGYIAGQYYPP